MRGPLLFSERELHLDDRCHTGARRGEHGEESVTLGADLLPFMGDEAGTDDPVMTGEDFGVWAISQAPEQRSRPLDVGEQKGERFRSQSLRDRSNGVVVSTG